MKKTYNFKNTITIFTLLFLSLFILTNGIFAETKGTSEPLVITDGGTYTYEEVKEINALDTEISEPLNTSIISYGYGGDEQLQTQSYLKQGVLVPNGQGTQIVQIYSSQTSSTVITYISDSVLMNGVVPFFDATESRYRIRISGVEGWVNKSHFNEYDISQIESINNYYVNDSGNLVHYISYQAVCPLNNQNQKICSGGSISNGPAPQYLEKGKKYLSFDGHYFYLLEQLEFMLQDFASDSTRYAINSTSPFYNYFQYLSYRAKTSYNSSILDSYLSLNGYTVYTDKTSSATLNRNESKLVGQSAHFFDLGTRFGLNPIFTFGIAINESGWGRSNIALQKNNIFGHAAYDSNTGAAISYDTIFDSIKAINTPLFNWGYMDFDPGFVTNYSGGYLGDKSGGFNVKYASDPYWGEKAVQTYYTIDGLNGFKDFKKETIGITKKSGDVRIYKNASTSQPFQYPKLRNNTAILIVDSLKGETINGSDVWYKIQSDVMMDSSGNPQVTLPNFAHRELPYIYEQSYYYVHASNITLVSEPISTPLQPTKPFDITISGSQKDGYILKGKGKSGEALIVRSANNSIVSQVNIGADGTFNITIASNLLTPQTTVSVSSKLGNIESEAVKLTVPAEPVSPTKPSSITLTGSQASGYVLQGNGKANELIVIKDAANKEIITTTVGSNGKISLAIQSRLLSPGSTVYVMSRIGSVESDRVSVTVPSEPVYKKGDINKDNTIDIRDMMVIRRHILKLELLNGADFTRADLNQDGTLDIRDMMAIRRHILKIEMLV